MHRQPTDLRFAFIPVTIDDYVTITLCRYLDYDGHGQSMFTVMMRIREMHIEVNTNRMFIKGMGFNCKILYVSLIWWSSVIRLLNTGNDSYVLYVFIMETSIKRLYRMSLCWQS